MNYNVRIDDNFLKADHSDGEVLQHTDLNELESVVKTAINANYLDIQKLEDGTISVAGATSLKGTDGVATLSQLINESLQPSDSKIPTSLQVKNFVENVVNTANTGLVFYWDGTGGQEGANIFNQICSKYDNNGKFVFYGRFSVDVGYDKPSGEHVEILRDVIAPIIVNKLTDRQSGNIDYLSFSFPPIFLGDKYAICSIQLTGNWGRFTDVRQMTWSDSMAPAMVKDTNSVNNLEFTGDYSSGATSGNIALTEDDANTLKNKLFSVNPGKLVTLKTNINGTVNLLGELTEHTIENDNMYYNIDFMELGQYASYKVTIKAHFTKTLLEGVEVWENDVEYTKMYITALGADVNEYFSDTISGGSSSSPGFLKTIKKMRSPLTINGTDASYMFYNFNLEELPQIDTSNVTDMSYMFYGSKATTLDLSSFNTSKVTNMSSMFANSAATTLDLSNFDTSNVTNISSMFANSAATTIDLSSFNTSNVTDMSYMFYGSKATTLDLSSFNTSKVTNMSSMFANSAATTLDLSNFDTSNVTNISSMFASSAATTIDLSNFDISKATSTISMFENSKVTTLDIRNFDFTNVAYYNDMFRNVSTNCLIIVKDDTAKEWITSKFTTLTNVKTVAE